MTQQITVPNPSKAANVARMTYEEFLDWSEMYAPHAEWVDGEVYLMPAVTDEHSWITGFLYAILAEYAQQKGLGKVLGEPYQMKLPTVGRGRQPDVIFVSAARASAIRHKFLDGPADLAIEVISEGSRRVDRVDKFAEYERAGVAEYWLIDSEYRIAEFFQRNDAGIFEQVIVGADRIYTSRAVHGLWIDTNWLWDRPSQIDVYRAWKLI